MKSIEAGAPEPPLAHDPFHPAPGVRVRSWQTLWSTIWPSLRFLFQTEVHVYAFAVAANLLISFFPFLAAMMILCRSVFRWQPATEVIIHTVNDYFPEGFHVDFRYYLVTASQQKLSWLSILLLFVTANGIFTPLEVAFNRIWRVKKDRSFLRHQLVSLGLIFGCGALALTSICLTALNTKFLTSTFRTAHPGALFQLVMLKAIALPMTMLAIFLIYWILPNARIDIKRLIPASIAVAILLEISQYLNILTWPWLRAKLQHDVPPFVQSISIILWSFIATLIILAGAEWSARVMVETLDSDSPAES